MTGRVVFDQVWKRFHRGPAHDSLRDLLPALARRVIGQHQPADDLSENDFWAVRDVSFEVKPGEALGIIGGNGAGKSTTLKLLTKILRPTKGTALVEGRVGSLIEVSAGFHPDLSGRENIFLQGAIMGMPQRLIRERFDDIVEFSGISAFIDTPVKRYSSGMNARLGFSIAVHLEPDVLIIDEVLSVGDAEFQGRAFGRIKAMAQSNIPVVIVSHQLDRVVELCSSCILLRGGEAIFQGTPAAAVQAYMAGDRSDTLTDAPIGVAGFVFRRLTMQNTGPVVSGERQLFELEGVVGSEGVRDHINLDVRVIDVVTQTCVYLNTLKGLGINTHHTGSFRWCLEFSANLPAGLYRIESLVWDDEAERVIGDSPSQVFQVKNPSGSRGTHQLSMKVVELAGKQNLEYSR